MKNSKAAVIIPTRGRDACLRQTLQDLSEQDFTDFEIWIVDQNTPSLQNLNAGSIPLHHEKTPPLGSSAGRNHAIFKTHAEICIFVDDDVRVPQEFIQAHVECYSSNQERIGAIAGRVVQPKDGLSEEQMRKTGAPARYNAHLGHISGNFIGFDRTHVHHIHECNFSAKTNALIKAGGFNTEFKGNAYFEGADLALKMIEAGFEIEYRPEIALTHLQEGAGGNRETDKAKHTYWYMRNYALLNSLHMHRTGFPFFGAYAIYYVLGKSVKNRSLSIAREGFRGFIDGLKYFII